MILYTNSVVDVNEDWLLKAPLSMDMASYLCWYDLPVSGSHLEHLGVMARAFIGTQMNQPNRPWGLVTELAEAMETSRETLYTIAKRVREGVLIRPNGRPTVQAVCSPSVVESAYPTVAVTPNRIIRTVLTNLLPGGMTTRPQIESLKVALDTHRCEGWISELIQAAGERAGRKLDEMDLSPLGGVVTARDELYFDDKVFLLNVEPRHFVIVSGYLEEICNANIWGVALQLDAQTRGLTITGLAEDGAKMYPASLREAELSVQVQKDVWHIEDTAGQAVTDLERQALRSMEHSERLLGQIEKAKVPEDDAHLKEWLNAEDETERLSALSVEVRRLRGHLCDALELVDWRSGEIRNRETNDWLLNEVLKELRSFDHPRVRKLVTYLEDQQNEMLTFLDWLEIQLSLWQPRLTQWLPDETQRAFFQATIARAWRLNRAVANGHKTFRSQAEFASAFMSELLSGDPMAIQLAEELLNILEGVVRTSCAAEAINSILRPYLTIKRSFQSRKTAQAWLNLFCLWFNMHFLRRSKRRIDKQPMSPYQYAGIKVYTPDGRETLDWLEAIGYPAD